MADYGNNSYSSTKYSNEESYSHFQEVNFCYIYKKKSGLKVRVHRGFVNSRNPSETDGWAAQIEAANVTKGMENTDNPPLDWKNEGIKVKMSMAELSTLAKYTDFAFIKALGSPIPMTDVNTGEVVKDASGRPTYKREKNGDTAVVKEIFFHRSKQTGEMATFKLEKSTYLYNGARISINKGNISINVTLSMDELILFARCCKMAFEFLCQAMVDESEEKYQSWKRAKENGIGVSKGYSKSSSNTSNDGGTKYYGYNGGGSSYTSYRGYNNNNAAQSSGPRPVSYDSVASGGTAVDNSPIINDGDDIPF